MNNTKIKYIEVENKIYEVTEISFCDMTITAVEINTSTADLPKEEIFGYELFSEFRIKLINKNDNAEIIDFVEWKSKNR